MTSSTISQSRSAWRDPRVLRWASFDVASSTYVALVPGFFGLYFASVLSAGHPGTGALWGMTAALSVIASAIFAPLAGAWADRRGRWHTIIVLATTLCIAATALLSQSPLLGVAAASAMFMLAQVGYTVGVGQYDALLVRLAGPAERSRVSTLAWATGMLGGVLAVAGALWLLRDVPRAAQIDQLPQIFLLCAVLFGALAVPSLWALRDLATAPVVTGSTVGGPSLLRAVWRTCREWRRHRTAFVLLAGFFLLNDVVVTLQFFGGIVLRDRFELSLRELLWLSMLFHVVALPSTVLGGVIADRIGAGRAMAWMCLILGTALLLLAIGSAGWAPVAVVLLGLVVAPLQAVFRALYAAHVPPAQMAELFGFNAVAGRLSAALGPLLFGVVAALAGTVSALLLLVLPLAAGLWLLRRAEAPAAA